MPRFFYCFVWLASTKYLWGILSAPCSVDSSVVRDALNNTVVTAGVVAALVFSMVIWVRSR